MATKRYISNRDCINRGDMVFGMGEHCEFSDEDAAPLLAVGAIVLPDAAGNVEPTADELAATKAKADADDAAALAKAKAEAKPAATKAPAKKK
jgi:hypothetical protein